MRRLERVIGDEGVFIIAGLRMLKNSSNTAAASGDLEGDRGVSNVHDGLPARHSRPKRGLGALARRGGSSTSDMRAVSSSMPTLDSWDARELVVGARGPADGGSTSNGLGLTAIQGEPGERTASAFRRKNGRWTAPPPMRTGRGAISWTDAIKFKIPVPCVPNGPSIAYPRKLIRRAQIKYHNN